MTDEFKATYTCKCGCKIMIESDSKKPDSKACNNCDAVVKKDTVITPKGL